MRSLVQCDLPFRLSAKQIEGRESNMLRTGIALLCYLPFAWVTSVSAQQAQQTDQRVADLVQSGKLKIGVFPS
jgi:hypothetical protein